MLDYVWLIPLFPAVGFLINGFFGRSFGKKVVSWVGPSVIGLSFVTSILIFFQLLGKPPTERHFEKVIFDWVVSGSFQTVIGYQIDPLSILMALVVSGVSFFIHIYSVGYMHDDPGFARYFTYLNLFVFMMLNAVNLTFITLSRFLQSLDGVLFAFFVMAVAAAEAAVGLAIFVMIYRLRETINVDEINILKW